MYFLTMVSMPEVSMNWRRKAILKVLAIECLGSRFKCLLLLVNGWRTAYCLLKYLQKLLNLLEISPRVLNKLTEQVLQEQLHERIKSILPAPCWI